MWNRAINIWKPDQRSDRNKQINYVTNDEYKIDLIDSPTMDKYDAIIIAVAHNEFKRMNINDIKVFGKTDRHIVYDIKSIYDTKYTHGRL